jgi:hypothetical protein
MAKWLRRGTGREEGREESKGTLVATVQTKSKVSQAPAAQPADPAQVPLADDLIRRIVKAIDEWSAANDLTNLPRKIVFEQALSIMTSLYEANNGGKKR